MRLLTLFQRRPLSLQEIRAHVLRSGQCVRFLPAQWCDEDGKWLDEWRHIKYPTAARFGVVRAGFSDPFWGFAAFDSEALFHYEREKPVLDDEWCTNSVKLLSELAETESLQRAFADILPNTGKAVKQ